MTKIQLSQVGVAVGWHRCWVVLWLVAVVVAGCGSTTGSDEPASADTSRATTAEVTAAPVPELGGLTFAEAKKRLRARNLTWRWILIQELDRPTDDLEVCRQEPAAGEKATAATVALGENCAALNQLPPLTGETLGEATRLLDAHKIAWYLVDGVDIDFPTSIDNAPPDWHVCNGNAWEAVDDAIAFLTYGESISGNLYTDGESADAQLQVAPKAASCYTTNDGEDP